jgi:hypothetical protein
LRSAKQKPSDKKATGDRVHRRDTHSELSIEGTISFCVNTIVPELEDNTRKLLIKTLSEKITDIDKEIQYIRDTRLRTFLRQHIDNKLVTEFMDSLAPLKIVDHLSSRSV